MFQLALKRVSAIIVAACAVATMMTACNGADGVDGRNAFPTPASNGPVSIEQLPSRICLSADTRLDAVQGHEVITNRGKRNAEIVGVSLVEPTGLRLRDAYVVPLGGKALIGSWSRWPPPQATEAPEESGWSKRSPAVGFEVIPDSKRAGIDLNLVTHVVRDSPDVEAGFSAIRMEYVVDQKRYFTVSSMRMTMKRRC
jgi:predicted small secreted protein